MELEIVPEPDEAERTAIVVALRDDDERSLDHAYASAWRRDGIAAADEDD